MAFRWQADDSPHIVVFLIFDPSSPHQTKKKCQSWTPSDKTFWIRAWSLSTFKLPLGGLARNSVVRIIDRPDMTSAVDCGCKASTRQTMLRRLSFICLSRFFFQISSAPKLLGQSKPYFVWMLMDRKNENVSKRDSNQSTQL